GSRRARPRDSCFLCHLNQDLAYIFRQEVYGEAVVRSQVPPLNGLTEAME
ncbi:hypothetical protein EE612_059138, partial [Oryza sativa]